MTRRRRLLLFGTGIALLTCAAVGSWLVYRATQEPDPVRVYHFIEPGMSKDEVERIIEHSFTQRRPLDVFAISTSTPKILHMTNGNLFDAQPGVETLMWYSENYAYCLGMTFDADGKLDRKGLVEFSKLPLFQRLRNWLGL